LLKECSQLEVERLLLKIIPNRYFELKKEAYRVEYPEEDGYTLNIILPLFEKCFRIAFDMTPDEVKKKVTEKFVSILREEDRDMVFTYETAFFRAKDLSYLGAEDILLAKKHLLSRLEQENTISLPLLQAVEGLGKYLEFREISNFVDLIVRTITSPEQPEELVKAAKDYIVAEFIDLDLYDKKRNKVEKRLDDWIAHFEKKDKKSFAESLKHLRGLFDVPF
jgi:hypothetical protein